LEWQINQDSTREKLCDMRIREARAREVEKLQQKIGNLSDTPNVTCGICVICQTKKYGSEVSAVSNRRTLRASSQQRRASPLKGVRVNQSCPQLRVSLS